MHIVFFVVKPLSEKQCIWFIHEPPSVPRIIHCRFWVGARERQRGFEAILNRIQATVASSRQDFVLKSRRQVVQVRYQLIPARHQFISVGHTRGEFAKLSNCCTDRCRMRRHFLPVRRASAAFGARFWAEAIPRIPRTPNI